MKVADEGFSLTIVFRLYLLGICTQISSYVNNAVQVNIFI